MSTPTEITIRPNRWNDGPCFGVCTPGDTAQINSEDLAKAANPLHQIPFVSQVYEAATGDTGSAAAKLIGGALIGGPIGFLASLADVIFTQETGKGMLGTAYAALTGDGEDTTQVASAAAEAQVASLAPEIERPLEATVAATDTAVEPVTQEVLPPQASLDRTKQDELVARVLRTKANLASGIATQAPITQMRTDSGQNDADILSLFGGQKPSAHKSYEKAQMLPYLKDVSTSMVL